MTRNTGVGAVTIAGALALAIGGCAASAESAQEGSVVPTDVQVAGERADKGRLKGAEDAPVRIVEISDFQCPFCRQFHDETLTRIDSAYIETGKVNYLWVSYANPGHSQAFTSSEAAFCAGAVGKFWPMHDILFERQEEWSGSPDPYALFVSYAEEINIEPESFGSCVRNSLLASLLLRDYMSVSRAGISSTPYFILADSVAIRGAADFSTFSQAIDTLLVLKGAANDDEIEQP
ncbi:MAG: DsbA family protein [Gemmatimonadetes bacterium]|nr:DsbA family protein [Gemmatimonadota bacterium]